ncbi:hypothetical protein GCK72_015672 [Caenorhabditis remanei]|uniref:SET domain-containing protein n=1 Tax=Caenorhabditis remanei TaxID=31234 RepID=A0A6A5GX65_CAERE|nr:hypothetical protein GCK72_015672 [Caenorhabditis remanei]KAF1759211.1 hypothetical protein GCK72_015672 [Caenorhabditis remanei]
MVYRCECKGIKKCPNCGCGHRNLSKSKELAGNGKRIESGEFIIAYIGPKRRWRKAVLKAGKYHIDPTFYGNKARFANHCCDPNAIVENWTMDRAPQGFKALAFATCPHSPIH